MKPESTLPTTQYLNRPTPLSAIHCRFDSQWSTNSQFAAEVAELLHGRLRIVALIALIPLTLFLLRNLFGADRRFMIDSMGVAFQSVVTVIIAGVAVWLWQNQVRLLCQLRKIETVMFTTLIAFFSYLQLQILRHADLFRVSEQDCGLGVVQLWIEGSALRWFFLIVIYGVFIPNTWKRCALLTGITALLPLILTPIGAWWHQHVCPEVLWGLLDLAILMSTACAVAVFGAYRLQVLQQEAFQAERLGQYRLLQKLGSGGMGDVYEAEHILLRRRCAIKLIRPEQLHEGATLKRFEREVQAMAALTHWNTIEVYDYGQADDGTFYYVMEYVNGMNLETLVQHHGPLSPGRVIYFLRQVCAALREAHGVGLLHRDIKPSNIMACRRGGVSDVVKLLDFGLVQQMKPSVESLRLTIQGAILGSPPYMSPEQAIGRGDLDGRTDIYSLGGVGYFLLTGRPPFVRETPMEMMLAHAYEEAQPPSLLRPDIPEDLQDILLCCLNKKPQDRFPNVDLLEKALANCPDADQWNEQLAAHWWENVSGSLDTMTSQPATMATG